MTAPTAVGRQADEPMVSGRLEIKGNWGMRTRNLFIAAVLATGPMQARSAHATLIASASSILTNAVHVFVGNSNGTPNPVGVAMFATFTPSGGLTLSQAAAALGYIGFDWRQTITNWPDANLRKFGGALITPVPATFPPFLDPPSGGYNYNPCGGKAPGVAATAFPFYFDPHGPANNCWSLSANETSTTLSFADEPMDHQLTQAEIAIGNVPKFATSLVGILPSGGPGPALFRWTWQTTYNGSAGSISSRSANSPYLQPGFGGIGHVTILTINGVPVSEPPGILVFAAVIAALVAARRSPARNKRAD